MILIVLFDPQKFKKMVEELISFHLEEMGITYEQFAQACELSSDPNYAMAVFDLILAVDDFLSKKNDLICAHWYIQDAIIINSCIPEIGFKKMMVKRNMELELQALA